jgi:sigma-B regulation protein RsbU (phosphoserine phosphatase)
MGKIISSRGVVLLQREPQQYSAATVKGLPESLIGEVVKISKVPSKILLTDKADARKYSWIQFFRQNGLQFVLPLKVLNTTLGVAGFNLMIPGKRLSAKEETYIKALGNIAAAAIEKGLAVEELRRVNRRLDTKVQELNTLFELSKEFSLVLDSDRLMRLLTFSLLGQVGAKRFFVALKQDGQMRIVQSKLDKQLDDSLGDFCSSVSTPLRVEKMTRVGQRTVQAMLKESAIDVLVPLQIHNETKGVIGVGERMSREPYSQTDIEFLISLGNLAIVSLENARLFREAIEKQKMEDELMIAREIQKGLLPSRLPNIPDFEIAAMNLSSKQVGGDYYDVVKLSPTRYVISIGDVSGKGTPASLLMANLQATIRALIPIGLPLAELTRRVNDLIFDSTGSDRFITFFWGILDTDTKKFRYVSAGHNPPLLFHSDGKIERLEEGGIILGVTKAIVPYQEGEAQFSSGDTLILYTDGVTEAMSKDSEEFGEERLTETAKPVLSQPADSILTKIVDVVKEHGKGVPQSDDITLIVLKAKT